MILILSMLTKNFMAHCFQKLTSLLQNQNTIQIFEPNKKVAVEVTYTETNTTTNDLYAYTRSDTKDKYSVFLDGNHPMNTSISLACMKSN